MTILTNASGCSQKNRCPAPCEELDARTGDPVGEHLRVALVDDVVVGALQDQRRRGDLAVDSREGRAGGGLRLPAGRDRAGSRRAAR